MKILALDTTEQSCSVALGDQKRMIHRLEAAPQQHSRLILPMIEALMAEAGWSIHQLDAIAFSRGPGSFTGIRIGISTVQGLALAADLPVLPISSLQALAQGAWRQYHAERVLAALDARMGECYYNYYHCQQGRMQPEAEEALASPDQIKTAGYIGVGSAFKQGLMAAQSYADQMIQAVDILSLAQYDYQQGRAVPVEQALPVYLRNQVATPKPAFG